MDNVPMPESPAFPFLHTAWPPLCTRHPQVVHKAPGGALLVAEGLPMPTAHSTVPRRCGRAGYPAVPARPGARVHLERSDPGGSSRRRRFPPYVRKPTMMPWWRGPLPPRRL